MPEEDKKLSETMRIDLIPDVPSEPVKEKEKRVVISSPTRRHKRVRIRHTEMMLKGRGDDDGSEGPRYEELLQSVYDAAIITDLTGKILDSNVRAVDFLQYDRSELAGMTLFNVLSGADESLIQMLSENLENERFTLIQAYCVRKDSSFFPSEIAVNRLSIGGMKLCFFIRDITIRRQSEEMLRTEHNALQNSGNGIAIANLYTEIEYANPATATMWGFEKPEDLKGMEARELFYDREAAEKIITSVIENASSWGAESKARRRDGSEFEVQVSAACNRNSDGETIGVIFSFVDISDRKRAEDAVREADRHRVMLESLGAACHHLGQPATVLLANLGIMQKKVEPQIQDGAIKDLIQTSIEAAEMLGTILHRLNTVNEYKTTQYLEQQEGLDTGDSRILEI